MIATRSDNRRAAKGRSALPRPRKEPDKTRYSGRMAALLRELRESAGLSPDDMASRVTKAGYKLATSTLYAWENGNLQIQVDALPILARVLKRRLSELLPER